MSLLSRYEVTDWRPAPSAEERERAIRDLENGRVLYFPDLSFPPESGEAELFSERWSHASKKNISFDPGTDRIKGLSEEGGASEKVRRMMRRYADLSRDLVHALFPEYADRLRRARTSFRPVEVSGRPSSLSKDDTRLHVDAFPSAPTGGKRILRVFCNVNPEGRTRNWRLGEPFQPYAERFAPRVRMPLPGTFGVMRGLRLTKAKQTLYDHYMLRLHDLGKADNDYQAHCPQEGFEFPPGATWLCFTDQVLHAVLAGQHLLEQTFYLPVAAQRWPELSPLRRLEQLTGKRLSRRVASLQGRHGGYRRGPAQGASRPPRQGPGPGPR